MHGLSGRHLLFLPLLASACQSLRSVEVEPRSVTSLPTHSWVVLVGGARVPVERGIVTRDSIVGFQDNGKRFAVSHDSVASLETRGESADPAFRALKWTLIVVGVGIALLLMVTLSEFQ